MFGDKNDGLASRALAHLFDSNNTQVPQPEDFENDDFSDTDTIISDLESSIFVSICQIYNETISDLLSSGSSLKLKQDRSGSYFIQGLSQQEVTSVDQVLKLVERAQGLRA